MCVSKSQNVYDFGEYATKYKDKDIIYLNIKTEVSVDISKSDLKIEETGLPTYIPTYLRFHDVFNYLWTHLIHGIQISRL